jgi:hypothetical protein
MSDEVRYGAGGIPYKAKAPVKPKKEKAESKVGVEVKISEEETSDAELAKLGLTNDENV